MIIRKATKQDFDDIYKLIQEAFTTAEVSDGKEQDFVLELRARNTYVEELEFVAQDDDGELIGHIMFSKQLVNLQQGEVNALLVAPLCVKLSQRNCGIGTKLMQYGFVQAEKLGYNTAFLIGNPEYYKRFGFKQTGVWHIKNTTGLPDKYVMAAEIVKNSLDNVCGEVNIH